jgi:hypothetical protein
MSDGHFRGTQNRIRIVTSPNQIESDLRGIVSEQTNQQRDEIEMKGLTKAVAYSFVQWLPTPVAVLLEHLTPPAIQKPSELIQVPRHSNRDSLKNAIQSIRSVPKGAPLLRCRTINNDCGITKICL